MAATYRGGGGAETDPSVGPAIAAHNDETTGVHGIPDTAVLATADDVADAVAAEATARATALDAKQNLTEKGEPSGYAALDADGRVLDGSGVPVGSTVEPDTGRNALTQDFYAAGFGVAADAKTVSDGAMTSSSATLTSASAAFTAEDVGKVVVVDNAKGAGTHLYGTITGYTNATTVTLSTTASQTIANADVTYGTDDTTELQAAIDAAVAGRGRLNLPPTPCLTTSVLTVSGPCEITAPSMHAIGGANTSGAASESAAVAAGDILPMALPVTAPYFSSGIVVAASTTDGIKITAAGQAVNLKNIGVRFAGRFKTTGHGIVVEPPALSAPSSGRNSGLLGARWDNVMVYGHASAKYGFYITNPLQCTFSHLQAFGGGGLFVESNSSIGYYGNSVFVHLYCTSFTNSTADSIACVTTLGLLNLLTFIRPQTLTWSTYAGTRLSAYGTLGAGSGVGVRSTNTQSVAMIGPNFERTTYAGSFADWFFGAGGIGLVGADGKEIAALPTNTRQLNVDGSITLNTSETAGTIHYLLNDRAAGDAWGVAADGTGKFYVPGKFEAAGKALSAATGAGLGTTPPPMLVTGSDLAGNVIFGSGTSPAAGVVGTVSFNRSYTTPPAVTLTPSNSATQALGLYVSAVTTSGFTVSAANAPSASQAVTTYAFAFHAIGVAAAPVAPLVYDSFNKADSALLLGSPQIGSAPSVGGTWGISSNQAYMVSSGTGNSAIWEASAADVTVSVVMSTVAGNCGIIFRAAGTNDYLYVIANGQVWRNASGTFTQLGTCTGSFVTGDTASVVTSGTSITVKKNGTTIGTFTSSANQTATKHGLTNNGSNAARFDNFQIA